MKKALWVVELLIEDTGAWEPSVGVSLTRADGREELKDWRQRNPSDKFRLRRYVPDEAQP